MSFIGWYSDYCEIIENGAIELAENFKCLVGVTQDKEDDAILVTYTHIVQKYKISKDDKIRKVSEWRTSYHLTSPIVYDNLLESYIGVINNDTIKVWKNKIHNLDDGEKYRFHLPVFRVLTRQHKVPYIVFKNGNCVTLEYGIENYASYNATGLVKDTGQIVDVAAFTRNKTDHICYVMKDRQNRYSIVTSTLRDGVADSSSVCRTKEVQPVKGQEASVVTALIFVSSSQSPLVYLRWNNNFISKFDVVKNCWRFKFYPGWWGHQKENMVCINKNFMVEYGKSTYEKKSVISIIHKTLPRRFGGRTETMKPVDNAKLYHFGNFLLLVNTEQINVWNIKFHSPEVQRWERYNDIHFQLLRLRRPEDFLPIFGCSKAKIYRQTLGHVL